MFKKILLYGVAFGSVAGAFLFIHFNNYGAEASSAFRIFYTLFQFVVIPTTAVMMLIKSLRAEFRTVDQEPIKPGNMIMAGLFTSLVMSLTVSLIYTFIHATFPALIDNAIAFDTQNLEAKKDKIIEQFSERNADFSFDKFVQDCIGLYNVGTQFTTNTFQYSSVGLFVSGIMSLYYMNKDKKNKAQPQA